MNEYMYEGRVPTTTPVYEKITCDSVRRMSSWDEFGNNYYSFQQTLGDDAKLKKCRDIYKLPEDDRLYCFFCTLLLIQTVKLGSRHGRNDFYLYSHHHGGI